MTAFLYLNDVEEGGGTHFNNLGITVQPKTGRAVLWPSVTDHDPDAKEYRTDHEALPVIKGVKYAGAFCGLKLRLRAALNGYHRQRKWVGSLSIFCFFSLSKR